MCMNPNVFACRYWFPDEDYNSGLHHHHPAALGHCRTGEVGSLISVISQHHIFYSHGCCFPFFFSPLSVQVSQHHWAVLPKSWRYPCYIWHISAALLLCCERMDGLCGGESRWMSWVVGFKNMQSSLNTLNIHIQQQWEEIHDYCSLYGVTWVFFRCLCRQCLSMVFSQITNMNTLKSVYCNLMCIQEKMRDGAVLMLLGNKLDLESHSRNVTTREGRRLAEVRCIWIFKQPSAGIWCQSKKSISEISFSSTIWFMQQHKALFYECSAKTGCNIEELMTHLAGYGISFLYCTCSFKELSILPHSVANLLDT